jgi:hypothetical protein
MSSANRYIDPSASVTAMTVLIVLYKAPENQHASLEGDGKWNIVENAKPRRK